MTSLNAWLTSATILSLFQSPLARHTVAMSAALICSSCSTLQPDVFSTSSTCSSASCARSRISCGCVGAGCGDLTAAGRAIAGSVLRMEPMLATARWTTGGAMLCGVFCDEDGEACDGCDWLLLWKFNSGVLLLVGSS